MKRKLLTVCLFRKDGEVLLGMKKRGFGMGRWNGFGGKVEVGETIEEAAMREVLEEISVSVSEIEKFAEILFSFEGKEEVLDVHFFSALKWTGEPKESEEMKPKWFPVDKIPYKKMWSDDEYWFPLFLAGKKFKGKFHFDTRDKVLEYELNEEK
ncbi:MAG: 8-oxo-dGTP diphosphatase [Candidatus Pacebacteria bacterium]|nr:8-oxo-dGTP diphosphatase [Candidatus Paceibacterota bacterium]MDD5356558.1 8-oxo-dGTP diphosphatase [Candidatus Paceibacterota bacterium]